MRNTSSNKGRRGFYIAVVCGFMLSILIVGCVENSHPPTFIEVGKSYEVGNGVMTTTTITIVRDMGSGWYFVKDERNDEYYFNMSHATRIWPK